MMEAMAMELPTIGTNFGGNLAFMDEHNSLLVNVSHFEPSDDPSFKSNIALTLVSLIQVY